MDGAGLRCPQFGTAPRFGAHGEEPGVLLGFGIVAAIIWIAIAFWPARVARRKGHSFIGYFILSLFFFSARAAYGVHGP